MDIAIFQIDPEKDRQRMSFESYDRLVRRQGSEEIEASVYGKVFEGEVDADDLEEIFEFFNLERPEGFTGHSLSVSDIVAVRDAASGKSTYYYCNDIGFRDVPFDESRAAERLKHKIRVVLCEPGRVARYAEIGTELEDLQKAVGGMIEAYYPFEEEVCIVCNDEGKLNGMLPNRSVRGEDGSVQDIIFGPFFICGCSGYEFGSLNSEQLERYGHLFECPERFYRLNDTIVGMPYVPSQDRNRAR